MADMSPMPPVDHHTAVRDIPELHAAVVMDGQGLTAQA
jgi:hypothetical protein